MNQRALYDDMPRFEWREAAVYWKSTPSTRTLEPELGVHCPCGTPDWILWGDAHWSRWPRGDANSTSYAGAVFATLLDSPLVVPPINGGSSPRPLAAVIADMVLLTGGWQFLDLDGAFDSATGPLGWSAVVWELLLRSARNEHRRRERDRSWGDWGPDRDPVRFSGEESIEWIETDDGDDKAGIAVLRVKLDGREADIAPMAFSE